GWLKLEESVPDETVRKWLAEWDALARSQVREAHVSYTRNRNDLSEGYRYREEPDGGGGVRRIPLPQREKDTWGRYVGEPKGWIDWPRYWKERIAPRFAPAKSDRK